MAQDERAADERKRFATLEEKAERVRWYFLTLPFVFLAVGVQSASFGPEAAVGSVVELVSWAALFLSGVLAAAGVESGPDAHRSRGTHEYVREILRDPVISKNLVAKEHFEKEERTMRVKAQALSAIGPLGHVAHRLSLLVGIPALLVGRALQAWSI